MQLAGSELPMQLMMLLLVKFLTQEEPSRFDLNLAEKIIDMTATRARHQSRFIPYEDAYADGLEDMENKKAGY